MGELNMKSRAIIAFFIHFQSKRLINQNYLLQIIELLPSMGVQWILVASSLMGAFGSFTSLLTGVLAYMGAASDGGDARTARFGVLLSMSFFAGTVGPVIAGFMVIIVQQVARILWQNDDKSFAFF
jgi:hypothetical protein